MIEMHMKTDTFARRRSANFALPDRVIGVYFGLFPLLVFIFLATQAARAHHVDSAVNAPMQISAVQPAR